MILFHVRLVLPRRLMHTCVDIGYCVDSALWRKQLGAVPPQVAALLELDLLQTVYANSPVQPSAARMASLQALRRHASSIAGLGSPQKDSLPGPVSSPRLGPTSATNSGGAGSSEANSPALGAWKAWQLSTRSARPDAGSWGVAVDVTSSLCAVCQRSVSQAVALRGSVGFVVFRCGHTYHDCCLSEHLSTCPVCL